MNITVKEAAEVTGWSEAYIRSACKRGIIGDAWSGGKGQRMTSIVSPGRLASFMGKDLKELEEDVRRVRYERLRKTLHGSAE